jgi:hypothetical protein
LQQIFQEHAPFEVMARNSGSVDARRLPSTLRR